MSPDLSKRAHPIFTEAADLPPAEQASLIEARCGEDHALRAVVWDMLKHMQGEERQGEEEDPLDALFQNKARDAAREVLNPEPKRNHVAPGTILGPCQVIEEIGKGGMGVVYRCLHTRLNSHVALKTLPAHLADNPEHIKRFKSEGYNLAKLNHPNIVRITDIDEKDGLWFIVMELIDGKPLEIPQTGMKLSEFLNLAIQLCMALEAAHEAGIVHRDLKPPNIMIDPKGSLKVLDFGLARLQENRESRGGTLFRGAGTPPYMSPEQILCDPLNRLTDIFSLGVLFYHMLSGRSPFPGKAAHVICRAVLSNEPTPLRTLRSDLPEALCRWVEICLEKDRDKRIYSAADLLGKLKTMQRDLEAGLLREPTRDPSEQPTRLSSPAPTQPTEATTPTPPPPPQKRRLKWLAAALGLLTLVVLGFNNYILEKLQARRLLTEARNLYGKQNFEDASSALRNALDFDPNLIDAWFLLVDCQQAQGFRAQALNTLQEAKDILEQSDDPINSKLLEARYYTHCLAYDKALAPFTDLARLRPDNPKYRQDLHDCYVELNQQEKAIEAISQALFIDQDNAYYAGMSAIALGENNQPEQALVQLNNFRRAHGDTAYLSWGEGLAKLALGDREGAEAAFAKMTADAEPSIVSWGRRLQVAVYAYHGEFEKASAVLLENVKEDNRTQNWDNYFAGKLWLAQIHISRGENELAKGYLSDFDDLAISVKNIRAFRRLAALHLELGNMEQTASLVAKLDTLRRDYPSLHSRRAYFTAAAALAVVKQDHDAAVNSFRQAHENIPDAQLYWIHAQYSRSREMWRAAADAYSQVIENKGKVLRDHFPAFWVKAHYHRGQCYEKLGRVEKAAEDYRRFLDLWGGQPDEHALVRAAMQSLDTLSQ